MNIVHITTVHQRFDSRIFYKECVTLHSKGNKVTLIVADNKGNQNVNGIDIVDIGLESSRLKRLLFSSKRAVKVAKSLKADIYHFHDPDLLIAVRKLTKKSKVIFDSHEDFPKLMLQREYIPNILRKLLFKIATHIEKKTYKQIFAVITATDKIKDKFLSYSKGNVISVKNFPILSFDDKLTKQDYLSRKPLAVYVGGLTKVRGVKEMILSCEKADVPLMLAGPFDDEEYFLQMQSLSGWNNVQYLGVVPHNELKEKVYNKATIGLNMLLKAPNHKDAIPIKQLEYMSENLPVISTEYIEFCKKITDKTNCGIIIKPENIEEVAKAIKKLATDKEYAYSLGQNGYLSTQYQYNWQKESRKLIDLYNTSMQS